MTDDSVAARFEKRADITTESPTLIEGLPGLGLVASIAVDRITNQLELTQYGTIRSENFPSVTSFADGRVRNTVRVYAGADPAVMTLQSDIPIPPSAVDSLSHAVLDDLAAEFGRAVFLVGAPAESEDARGEVVGIATTDDLEAALVDAEITLASGTGVIGGVTGALLNDCYDAGIPAAALVVKAHPFVPDPGAAHDVIENALEPLVEFDVDTQELLDQAEEIRNQKRQIAAQLEQYQEQEPQAHGMYQ